MREWRFWWLDRWDLSPLSWCKPIGVDSSLSCSAKRAKWPCSECWAWNRPINREGTDNPMAKQDFFRQRQGVQTGYIKLHPFGNKNFEDFLYEIVEVQLRSPERLCLQHERYNKKFNIVELCTWPFKSSIMYVGLLYFWDFVGLFERSPPKLSKPKLNRLFHTIVKNHERSLHHSAWATNVTS